MTKALTTEQIQALAGAYALALSEFLTSAEWNEIIRLNGEAGDDTYDATHDFVDANHYLCTAYEDMFGETPILDDQNMHDLSAAVDYALKHFFVVRKDFVLFKQ